MKDKTIKVRMSEELFNLLTLKAKAINKNNSEFIREAIQETEVKQSNEKDKSKLIASLNQIGNNLNQMQKAINIANLQNKLEDIDYKDIKNMLAIATRYIKDISENN